MFSTVEKRRARNNKGEKNMKKVIVLLALMVGCGGGGWSDDDRDTFLNNCTELSSASYGPFCLCLLNNVEGEYTYDQWRDGDVNKTDSIEISDRCIEEVYGD